MRTLSSSQQIYDNGKTVARTGRVIGHRVAILEHAETDGDGEQGDGRARRERMDRESKRGRKTKEMKKDAESEIEMS